MTLTTDPRGISAGRVQISNTSTVKRDALVGRRVAVSTYSEGRKVGTVERIEGSYAIVRFPDGRWFRSTSVVKLVA